MSTLVIRRFAYTPLGVFGRLTFFDFYLYTLECPWMDNRPFLSCVPEGEYALEKSYSNKFKRDMYRVKEVENRSGILIHKGNSIKDITGCIVVGEELGCARVGKEFTWGVLDSASAYNRLCAALDRVNEPTLTITHEKPQGILK